MARRITDEEIEEAKRLRSEGWIYQRIADKLGYAVSTIHVALNPSSARRKKEYREEHKSKAKKTDRPKKIITPEMQEERMEKKRAHKRAYYEKHKEKEREY